MASLCLAMLVGIPGFAQERSSGAGGGAGKTRRATALIGASLTSRDGAALGKISDLVIDNRGHVDYVIVRHDTGYLAVPWAVVTGTGANLSVSVNVTREALRDVTFPDSNWPDFTSPRWTRAARTTWGEAALRRRPGGHR
ncbi:MAG: PRC-barrel domain-containing protein [Gemmataceae bacterium]